jgi:hypothetical protein
MPDEKKDGKKTKRIQKNGRTYIGNSSLFVFGDLQKCEKSNIVK